MKVNRFFPPGFFLHLVVLLPVILLLGACDRPKCSGTAPGPRIEALDAWMRAVQVEPTPTAVPEGTPVDAPAVSRGSTAAYLTLQNCGGALDHLIAVQSDVAEIVELHKTETRNGMTMMTEVQNMELPAGSSIALKPGGLHIMLIRMKRSLIPGEKVILRLQFEQSGPQDITVEVRAP